MVAIIKFEFLKLYNINIFAIKIIKERLVYDEAIASIPIKIKIMIIFAVHYIAYINFYLYFCVRFYTNTHTDKFLSKKIYDEQTP